MCGKYGDFVEQFSFDIVALQSVSPCLTEIKEIAEGSRADTSIVRRRQIHSAHTILSTGRDRRNSLIISQRASVCNHTYSDSTVWYLTYPPDTYTYIHIPYNLTFNGMSLYERFNRDASLTTAQL